MTRQLVFMTILLAILCSLAHLQGAEPSLQLRQVLAKADLKMLKPVFRETERMTHQLTRSVEDRIAQWAD